MDYEFHAQAELRVKCPVVVPPGYAHARQREDNPVGQVRIDLQRDGPAIEETVAVAERRETVIEPPLAPVHALVTGQRRAAEVKKKVLDGSARNL